MSVPEAQPLPITDAAVPSAPRRKRRRTSATGAANDCFTCSSQNASCDRKRPYCTPCLDKGKDCAGYKTTLTWGVGVASRGKLRGLSLPVAGNKQKPLARQRNSPRERDTLKSELPRQRVQKSGLANTPLHAFSASTMLASDDHQFAETLNMKWQSMLPAPPIASYPQTSSSQNSAAISSPPNSFSEDTLSSNKSDQFVFTARTGSHKTYSEQGRRQFSGNDVHSESTSQLRGSQWLQRSPSYNQNATNFRPPESAAVWPAQFDRERSSSPSRCDASRLGKAPSCTQIDGQKLLGLMNVDSASSQYEGYPESCAEATEVQNQAHLNSKREHVSPPSDSFNQTSLMLSPFSSGRAIGKTPRMQYLINYYTEVISPVIVAFDGPTNPYRNFILRLASESETLQHAISALSASNLRQRRESGELSTGKTDPARRSSMAHLTLTDKAWQSAPGYISVENQRKEENYHKNATVHLIQKQFADPAQHRDDSVLATLLVVCLFHICESGVAKFRTHFAGAKKLLGMRENATILKSKEAKWFTRMFTWFDAMTATVNDREGQMQDGLLDMSSLLDEDWTLENLAGCDGKLFKIMAKLSRLNILSQNGVLDDVSATASCSAPVLAPDLSYWDNFGGDIWTNNSNGGEISTLSESYPDMHTQYGREWHETRHALMSWRLDTTPFNSGSCDAPALSGDQQVDLLNISESFRFSALIYLERLALPHVPSSDPRIQAWVQKALYFIELVRSDVYLLWPLFVTGSECVSENDRHIIGQRCLDIQKDSGFSNNASCLKLLEKIWTSNSNTAGNATQPEGFRWRSVMEANASGGEYIVV